jgi:hypothetical protein
MELSPIWKAASCATSEELPSILRNPKVHYRVNKSPPLVPILSQSIHSLPSNIHLYSSDTFKYYSPSLALPTSLFSSGFPIHMHSSSPHSCYMPCSPNPPWHDYSSYTCRRVKVMKLLTTQLSPTSLHFLFRPNIVLNTLFSNSPASASIHVYQRNRPHSFITYALKM